MSRASYADLMTTAQQQRFWANVDKSGAKGCWVWTLRLNSGGYGTVTAAPHVRTARAHRVAWELTRSRIPDGLTIDHLCRNRACVNPSHLAVVSIGENTLRGVGVSATNARRTHCENGHELTPENVYRQPSRPKRRLCRACRADKQRAAGNKRYRALAAVGLCSRCKAPLAESSVAYCAEHLEVNRQRQAAYRERRRAS